MKNTIEINAKLAKFQVGMRLEALEREIAECEAGVINEYGKKVSWDSDDEFVMDSLHQILVILGYANLGDFRCEYEEDEDSDPGVDKENWGLVPAVDLPDGKFNNPIEQAKVVCRQAREFLASLEGGED